MFGTIRKHQTWLWAVIITLTIISFVSFLSPNSRLNSGRGGDNFGSINGEKITREQYASAYREVDLHNLFMKGHWYNEDKRQTRDPEREIYEWLLLIQLQSKAGIHVGEDVAAATGQQLLRSLERTGVSSPSIFIERVLQPHGLSVDDFERFIRHFVGIQQLINTYGLSGRLVTPQEAKACVRPGTPGRLGGCRVHLGFQLFGECLGQSRHDLGVLFQPDRQLHHSRARTSGLCALQRDQLPGPGPECPELEPDRLGRGQLPAVGEQLLQGCQNPGRSQGQDPTAVDPDGGHGRGSKKGAGFCECAV